MDWAQLGIDIINGIIRGLVSMAGQLWEQIKKIVKGALTAGQNAAETGSPSKLFERELGQWIPAGIALGVDKGAYTVDQAVRNAITGAVSQPLPAPMAQTAGIDEAKLAAALANVQLVSRVSLEGDAKRLFRVVRSENATETRRTNNNALAAAGV